MHRAYRPLLDALVARGVDAQAVEDSAAESESTGRSIRDILINDHVVTEVELTEASADVNGISSVDLVGYPLDPAAVAKIPLALVLRHRTSGIDLELKKLGFIAL
jgi:type IV pilus assembly protein PilB